MNSEMQTLKGFRDFTPAQMKLRQNVIKTLKSVFESFGYEALETPSLEYSSTLLGKYGEEADKLVYTFQDRGERNIGLIYDLTVPTARYIASNQGKIVTPFKRYQIQKVWRAEKPQKGRYREFTQCDVDIFGIKNPASDAEIMAIINEVMKSLKFTNYTIKVNSRKNLFDLLEKAKITDPELQQKTLQTIDKLDKKSEQEVVDELKERSLTQAQIDALFELLHKYESNPSEMIDENLKQVISAAEDMGVKQKTDQESGYLITPSLVRGLSYYTGTIYETVVEEPKIGSITGGGRYDNLIEMLGGPSTPAVGTTIGLDRICDVLEDLNINPFEQQQKTVLVGSNAGYRHIATSLAQELRSNYILAEYYLEAEEKDQSEQIKYAIKKGKDVLCLIKDKENALLIDFTKDNRQELSIDKIASYLSEK